MNPDLEGRAIPPLPQHDQILDRIAEARVLPVIRAASTGDAAVIVRTLLNAGLGTVELTTTIPGWSDLLADLRRSDSQLCVGMGTVTTAADAETALEWGARFLVSPYPSAEVAAVADEACALFVEGGQTPGEVARAARRGVAKLFPAHACGPAYLRSLLAVMPGARVIPTGGIRLGDVNAWLAAGAFAVGVGSDLYAADDVRGKVAELRLTASGGIS
jgi:2-dehydro-3-deoxyphosphogluconate aldolase/(4S)-4-hydroxy-2-oxoglutarate aldolase